MTNQPTDAQLADLYRTWWQGSYGAIPNAQNTAIAAAFARHVLDTYGQPTDSEANEIIDYYARLKAQHAGQGCVYHPTMTGEQRDD